MSGNKKLVKQILISKLPIVILRNDLLCDVIVKEIEIC